MNYDGILFDLDGTLWDSSFAVAKSWQEALKGQPDVPFLPTEEQLKGVMGLSSEALMAKLFPSLSKERGQELFERCCEVEIRYLREHGGVLYEGLREVLTELSKSHFLGIISNCNDGYIESFLDAHEMRPFFTDWECIGRSGLPKWENIRLVAERSRLEAPVYVGDTPWDAEAAGKAGVPFIHAGYGFGEVPGVPRLASIRDLLKLV